MFHLNLYSMKRLFFIFMLITIHLMFFFPTKAQSVLSKMLHDEITEDLKNNILLFWEKYSVDPTGGFYGSLSRNGNPIINASKGVVLNARILWTYSTAYRMYGDSTYCALADRAQRYFIDYFIDSQYGGVYWEINAGGTPLNTHKHAYGCSFAIYGLSEHFRATGNIKSLEKAIDIYIDIENKIKDPINDGYIESFTREWNISEKQGFGGNNESTKTMNTHIHILEAYTSLYRVWRDNILRERLVRIIDLIITKFYDSNTHHLICYCDSDWNNLDDIDSYGHDIETSWLLIEAAEVLGDSLIFETCKKVSLELVNISLKEGVNSMGAMMNERNNNTIHKHVSWWCQAETIVGCIHAWKLTNKYFYLDSAFRTWEFIKYQMIDKDYGEWFRTILEDGTPCYNEPKASMWNCPYHNSRMGFEIDRILK